MSTEILRPNAAGDYENLPTVVGDGVGTHYTVVNEAVPDEDTGFVQNSTEGELKDAYNIDDTAIPAGSTINSVTVYFRVKTGYASQGARPSLRLGTNETAGTQIEPTTSWVTHNEALARPGGGSWAVADLNSLQVVIGLYVDTTGKWVRCTQIYVEIDYTEVVAKRGWFSKF